MVYIMKKIALFLLVISTTVSTNIDKVSTLSGVCLSGAVLQAKKDTPIVKYKRKDCPVCKGKGWYISGDGIAKVDCGYCEPESEEQPEPEATDIFKG